MSLTVFCVNARLFPQLFLDCSSSVCPTAVWYARALLWGFQTLVFLCCDNRAFVCYWSVCSWKEGQPMHVIHARFCCCLWITMHRKGALEESLLADVIMALPIYKYEPWHLYFPCPGLSLARCSEHWLLGNFNNDSSWHTIYCTHTHKMKVIWLFSNR